MKSLRGIGGSEISFSPDVQLNHIYEGPKTIQFIGFDLKNYPSVQVLRELACDHAGLIEVSSNADVVVCREDYKSLFHLLSLDSKTCVRILFCAEVASLDFNFFDFVIGWEDRNYGERYCRMHPALREARVLELDLKRLGPQVPLKDRDFCDFIYSNSQAHPMRDSFFLKLGQAKKVSSFGIHLKNSEIPDHAREFLGSWEGEKVAIQAKHKFSLAIENATYPGYTTEKLFTSIVAGSIPIYWGNPEVGVDFNQERFISLHNFKSTEDAISEILKLEEDVEALEQIIQKPLFTPEQDWRIRKNEKEIVELFRRAAAAANSGDLHRPQGTAITERERLALVMTRRERMISTIKGSIKLPSRLMDFWKTR